MENAINFNSIFSSVGSFLSYFTTLGIGGFLGTIFGYWFKARLEQNAENKRKIREAKEQQYRDFLNNLMGFFDGWENKDFKKQFIWDVCANAPVYASDDVIKLAHEFIESFDQQNKKSADVRDVIYGKLVLAIRKELNKIQGEPLTQLKVEDIKVRKLND